MTVVDAAILAILALSTLIAAWRGLVRSLISLFGWIAALLAALIFGEVVATWMPSGWSEPARAAAGHLLVFVCVLLAASLLGFWLARLVSAIGLGGVDRVLGALFGLARGALIVVVFTVMLSWTPVAEASAWRSSALLRWIEQALEAVAPQEAASAVKV